MSSLKHLKVGDYVYWSTFAGIQLAKIDRMTATQVICGDIRFNADTGWRIGASRWNNFYASPADDTIMLKFRIQRAQEGIRSLIVTEENVDRVRELLAEQDQKARETEVN